MDVERPEGSVLPSTGHDPVLLFEILKLFQPPPDGVAVDCTTGRGGHSLAFTDRLPPGGQLLCLDADPRNLAFARERLSHSSSFGRVRFFHANFSELRDVLKLAECPAVDFILADLGISTNQLFDAAYGMSFSADMPLDMRVDPTHGQSAADLVNTMKEEDFANVLYNLAQERYSRRIARKVVEARRQSPILSTGRLADLVRSAIPRRGGAPEKIDPATRTFLALRMAVNQELENLETLLVAAPTLLKPGGRLAVISFQSMEDRLVKQAFRALESTQPNAFKVLTPKPLSPSPEEVAVNPRSRSAKLRVLQKKED